METEEKGRTKDACRSELQTYRLSPPMRDGAASAAPAGEEAWGPSWAGWGLASSFPP